MGITQRRMLVVKLERPAEGDEAVVGQEAAAAE